MTVFQNHRAKAHLFVFLGIWFGCTALTYWIAEHGIEQDNHRRLVILTTLGTILGPMTGAIARNCQSCCLANSLSLLPYCGTNPLGITQEIRRKPLGEFALWESGLGRES